MPKSFNDVVNEYNSFRQQYPDDPTTLTDFAQQMDMAAGTPDRQEAYTDTSAKRANSLVDLVFEKAWAPQLTGNLGKFVGGGFDRLAGTNIAPVMESMGRETPRMLAEAALTIPEVESGAGAVPAAMMWLNRARKIAGYGSAALRGTAETGSLAGGAISAATLGVGNKLLAPIERGGMDVGGNAAARVQQYLEGKIPDINVAEGSNVLAPRPADTSLLLGAQRVLPSIARAGADVGSIGALNEVSRQASMTVGPNGVPLTDFKDRNPFTAENVAGNVVNAIPFIVPGAIAAAHAPEFASKTYAQMQKWFENRNLAEAAYRGYDYETTFNPVSYYDAFGKLPPGYFGEAMTSSATKDKSFLNNGTVFPSSTGSIGDAIYTDSTKRFSDAHVRVLMAALKQNVRAGKQFEAEGDPTRAGIHYGTATDIYSMLRGEEIPTSYKEELVKHVQDAVLQSPVGDFSGLADFTKQVNGIIDLFNQGRDTYEREVKRLEESPGTQAEINKRVEAYKASMAGKIGQTWNPEARDPAVIERLQGKGLLPKITPDWLKEQWDATFDTSGNPQFTSDVVGQKVANHLIEGTKVALELERQNPTHAKTEFSDRPLGTPGGAGVVQIDQQQKEFWKNWSALPSDIQDQVVGITLDLEKEGTKFVKGREKSRVSSWQRAVIQAGQTYDPETNTIMTLTGYKNENGKKVPQFSRRDVSSLVQRDEYGNPTHTILSPVRIGEGGKGSQKIGGKTVPETNIESLVKGQEGMGDEATDEEAWKAALAQDAVEQGGSMQAQSEAGLGVGKGEQFDPGIADEGQGKTLRIGEDLMKKAKDVQKALDSLTDKQLETLTKDQLWRKQGGRPVFSDPGAATRTPLIRYALKAALEDWKSDKVGPAGTEFLKRYGATLNLSGQGGARQQLVYALSKFFQHQREVEGAPKGVSNVEARVGKIVEGLLDEKKVNDVKTVKTYLPWNKKGDTWPHGAYLSPSGEIINVDDKGGHMGFGRKILGDKSIENSRGDYDQEEFDRVFGGMAAKGYIQLRGVEDGLQMIGGNNEKLTRTQKAALESWGIEKGLSVYDQNGDVIYSPPTAKEAPITGEPVSPFRTEATIDTTLHNRQPPGQFVEDVRNTVAAALDKEMARRGYSGSLRDMYVEMATTLALKMKDAPVDFFEVESRRIGGLAAHAAENVGAPRTQRGAVGLNLDSQYLKDSSFPAYASRLIDTLAHEMHHIDQFVLSGELKKPDAYSKERLQHLEALEYFSKQLTPDEKDVMIRTLMDGMVPKEFQHYPFEPSGSGRIYGSEDPEEFGAVVTQVITGSLLNGASEGKMRTALEALDYSPPEVRDFARGVYRSLSDTLGGLSKALGDLPLMKMSLGQEPPSEFRQVKSYRVLSQVLPAVVSAAELGSRLRKADYDLARAREYTASLSPGAAAAVPYVTPAKWRPVEEWGWQGYYTKKVPLNLDGAVDAINAAREVLTPRQLDAASKPGLWARWFFPFSQLMFNMERSGVPLAGPIRRLSEDLQTGITRTRSGILQPFLKTDPDGRVHLDEANPLVKLVTERKTGPWRVALNDISDWQQRNGAQNMFVEGKNGVEVNKDLPGAQAKWDSVKSKLSQEHQQLVAAARVSMDKVGQAGAQRLIASLDVTNRFRTAGLIMAMNPRMTYDQAKVVADATVNAMLRNDVQSLSRTAPPEQIEQLSKLLQGPEGLLAKFQEVAGLLSSRPGFSTESLSGDYIVRFIKPGADKPSYLSADTNYKALHLAKKLQQEGNRIDGEILHKDELKDFADFDSPDVLLQKFSEVEGAQWAKVVAGLEEKFGPDAAAMAQKFVPGATSLKEMALKGMKKFLVERESKVDTSRYDYTDGMMTWVSRLASSIAYKSTRMEKDLILNDPRAKMFPSLEKLVEPHFENLMSPTSKLSQELRTFSTAYMMGGSLASAIINGTQSAVTLIPTLIQLSKGGMGPVGAYASLSKAIAKASSVTFDDSWQKVATAAEKKDPTTWTLDEAQAALYKRNVEDGGITHGIIQGDIFSPTDQRTLMAAKFGHGDYGPTTPGEMARSGIYTASQLSLKPFGWIEAFNNKLSLFTGIEQGYKAGLRGDELYEHAKLVKVLSTYGGGKSNAPGLVPRLSNPYTRSAVGVVNTLQQYGYGTVATYAQLMKDSLGKSRGLSPLEQRQAQKAFGTMLMTQVAIGGALGLPFAAATLTALEKVFGIQANAAVRQGLASLGSDEEGGAVIAETALNGVGNQMFGIDLSSRVGVSNLLGTSAYKGFSLGDLAGPTASIVQNAVNGLNMFAQNNPAEGFKSLVPNAFKTLVEMSSSQQKYGDYGIRDSGGNLLYQPSAGQVGAYALGFRPRESSQKRQAQALMTTSNLAATQRTAGALDRAAQSLLTGDTGPSQQLVNSQRQADYTLNPRDVYSSIINRAVDSVTEKDLLASGPRSNEAQRVGIASTFGAGVVTRQSEIERESLKAQLAARLGVPELMPDASQYTRAAMVDALVKEKGWPRSQALRFLDTVMSDHSQ